VRFNLWFRRTRGLSCNETHFEVGVPSVFSAEWLENHHRDLIVDILSSKIGRCVSVKFIIDPKLFQDERTKQARTDVEMMEEAAGPALPRPFDARRYSLENFVVGPCNSMAYWGAVRVVENPEAADNPFFLHGGVGLGKTHLLWAIAGAVGSRGRKGRVAYVSAESFTNQYIFAVRNNKMHAFHKRYRDCRLLIIDDIHFLASKEGTQEEFLSTYKAVQRHGGQIVMASDSHPKLIGKLKAELVTRFLSGMLVKLEKPDFATRLEIVRRKAAERRLTLPEATAEFVARNVTGSVRELEGAVNTLAWYSDMAGGPVGISTARRLLEGLMESQCLPVRLPGIDDVVTRYAGLEEGKLRGKGRSRPVSQARHLAMYLAREMGRFSYSEIGAYFGGRSHSTVVSAVRKISDLLGEDARFASEVRSLKAEFGF